MRRLGNQTDAEGRGERVLTDRKLENKVLWIVNGSLVLIGLCLILILFTKEYQYLGIPSLFYDSNFLGALFGAVITGMISIVVFKLQKVKESVLEKQKFEKIYNENKRNLNFLDESLSKMGSGVEKNKYQSPKEVEVLNHYIRLVRSEIQAVDIKDVPYEIHEIFADLKDSLTTIQLSTDVLLRVKELSFLKDEFLSSISRFHYNLKQVESYLNECE